MPVRWSVAVGTSADPLWIEIVANDFGVIDSPARFRFFDDDGIAAEFPADRTLAIVRYDVFPVPGPDIVTPVEPAGKLKGWLKR